MIWISLDEEIHISDVPVSASSSSFRKPVDSQVRFEISISRLKSSSRIPPWSTSTLYNLNHRSNILTMTTLAAATKAWEAKNEASAEEATEIKLCFQTPPIAKVK